MVTGRYFGRTSQTPSQIRSRSADLFAAISANCRLQSFFCQARADAEEVARIVPVSDFIFERRQPYGEPWDVAQVSHARQRANAAAEIEKLPVGQFWLWPRTLGLDAVQLQAVRVDFDGLERRARAAPSDLREACRTTGPTRPLAELRRIRDLRRKHVRAVIAGARVAAPDFRDEPPEVATNAGAQADGRPEPQAPTPPDEPRKGPKRVKPPKGPPPLPPEADEDRPDSGTSAEGPSTPASWSMETGTKPPRPKPKPAPGDATADDPNAASTASPESRPDEPPKQPKARKNPLAGKRGHDPLGE